MVNFVFFLANAPPRGSSGAGAPPPLEVLRGFSGHWMAFYSAAAAVLYSAIVVRKSDPAARCRNGHLVTSSSAKFCETCGSALNTERDQAHDVLAG
jgi:hypothetical protein